MRTRVKICGITSIEDGLWAVHCGADALGFVLYEKSPRAVSIKKLAEICSAIPAFVSKVALFVDAEKATVEEVISQCAIDCLQFHGNESLQFCEQFTLPYIKAIRVKSKQSIEDALTGYPSASALLLDAYKPGVPGGTGEVFEWSWVRDDQSEVECEDVLSTPIVLAGGLTPGNVESAITETLPYAVDVSGGVEASKGIKDPKKVAEFITGVNSVQR
ncbi:MAG: phosphoribosylanthranilate isomerase [Pseudomonadales bacterium]|nr:phosphoribosylanthranilate isomerase [Pseudomonadales bacterium]